MFLTFFTLFFAFDAATNGDEERLCVINVAESEEQPGK